MNKKFTPTERRQYIIDKISQIGVTGDVLADTAHLDPLEVATLISGKNVIDDKTWVQLGLALTRLGKQKGVLTEKEEVQQGKRRSSRTSIIKQVEDLEFFKE